MRVLKYVNKRRTANIEAYNERLTAKDVARKRSTVHVNSQAFKSLFSDEKVEAPVPFAEYKFVRTTDRKIDAMVSPEDLDEEEFNLNYKTFFRRKQTLRLKGHD